MDNGHISSLTLNVITKSTYGAPENVWNNNIIITMFIEQFTRIYLLCPHSYKSEINKTIPNTTIRVGSTFMEQRYFQLAISVLKTILSIPYGLWRGCSWRPCDIPIPFHTVHTVYSVVLLYIICSSQYWSFSLSHISFISTFQSANNKRFHFLRNLVSGVYQEFEFLHMGLKCEPLYIENSRFFRSHNYTYLSYKTISLFRNIKVFLSNNDIIYFDLSFLF